MNVMPVALFSNRARAEPIRQRLKEAGFAAEIEEESALQRLWFVSRRNAGVSIDVPAEQFEVAEQRLLDWSRAEGGVREAIRCPECGSFRVDYPQFTRQSLLTNLVMGVAAGLRIVEKEYYCEECHYTWPKAGHKPRCARSHMAPYYFIEGVEQMGVHSPPSSADQPRKAA